MRAVEEARAQLEVATATLNAARERLKTIGQTTVGSGDLLIRAPFAGTILSVSAAEGQTVSSSAPLAEIAQVSTLWVKVPLYAGDADSRRSIEARVGDDARIAAIDRDRRCESRRLSTANPTSASVDLFYEVKGTGPRCGRASVSPCSCR